MKVSCLTRLWKNLDQLEKLYYSFLLLPSIVAVLNSCTLYGTVTGTLYEHLAPYSLATTSTNKKPLVLLQHPRSMAHKLMVVMAPCCCGTIARFFQALPSWIACNVMWFKMAAPGRAGKATRDILRHPCEFSRVQFGNHCSWLYWISSLGVRWLRAQS